MLTCQAEIRLAKRRIRQLQKDRWNMQIGIGLPLAIRGVESGLNLD